MPYKMGWLKDYPDFRDYDESHANVVPILTPLKMNERKLSIAADLRQWCSPIEDQGDLGSCTANAGVGILEYYERRAFNKYINASRLFLYKTTRDLMQVNGDVGAYLRTTMQAMATFGVLPESYWPYDVAAFDDEPDAFSYSFAKNYQAVTYYRLDTPGKTKPVLLQSIKSSISAGLPLMFGFTVYSSIYQANSTGKIPFPSRSEQVLGGHALDAVGYDDSIVIVNQYGGVKSTGAFLIRNSWGTSWGDRGYGWLPYDYVLKGLADDWWSLVKVSWFDTGVFF